MPRGIIADSVLQSSLISFSWDPVPQALLFWTSGCFPVPSFFKKKFSFHSFSWLETLLAQAAPNSL